MAEQIQGYFAEGLGTFLAYLPNLVAGIVILLIGYVVARLLGAITRKVLARAKFDEFMKRRLHPKLSEPSRPASRTTGRAVFWLGMLLTIALAADALLIPALAEGIYGILAYVPSLVVAVVIIAVAIGIGNVAAQFIATQWLARASRITIIALAVFMALNQLGVAPAIVNAAFIAVVGTVAVALAIAFGVGNIELAREYGRSFERRGKAEVQQARREEAPRREPPFRREEPGWRTESSGPEAKSEESAEKTNGGRPEEGPRY